LDRLGKLSIGKLHIWEIAYLGSCYLGKYPWEVADWENVLGKLF